MFDCNYKCNYAGNSINCFVTGAMFTNDLTRVVLGSPFKSLGGANWYITMPLEGVAIFDCDKFWKLFCIHCFSVLTRLFTDTAMWCQLLWVDSLAALDYCPMLELGVRWSLECGDDVFKSFCRGSVSHWDAELLGRSRCDADSAGLNLLPRETVKCVVTVGRHIFYLRCFN